MQKRKRKDLHSFLKKKFGSPLKMTTNQRMEIIAAFSGWMKQVKTGTSLPIDVRLTLTSPRTHSRHPGDVLSDRGWIGNHINKALSTFSMAAPRGHWTISAVVSLPSLNKGIRDALTLRQKEKVTVDDYDHIRSVGRKHVEIAISPTYHTTVAAHGLSRDGRRVVQAVWDQRSYDDISVWQCRYWDFTCLGGDPETWKKATNHGGYIAKTGTHVAVDQEFGKAMSMVKRKTVQSAIKSIVSEFGEDG